MIQGFQQQTQPLSQYEQEILVPIVARGLQTKVGKANSITNKEICSALKEKGYKVDTPRLRKIINHIRVSGLVRCVVATSDGYYIATTRGEVEDYLKSLENREGAIHAVRMSLESQMKFL